MAAAADRERRGVLRSVEAKPCREIPCDRFHRLVSSCGVTLLDRLEHGEHVFFLLRRQHALGHWKEHLILFGDVIAQKLDVVMGFDGETLRSMGVAILRCRKSRNDFTIVKTE